MEKSKRVVVLGSFVVDLAARTISLPKKGETVIGSYFKYGPGGKGANQAVAANRLGLDVTFMTKIGTDIFGTIASDFFKKEGLYSDFILESNDFNTGIALISLDEEGANNIIVVPGACARISDSEVDLLDSALDNSAVFLTQLEINLSAMNRGVDIAYSKKVPVVLNPAPVMPMEDSLLARINTITPNEIEAEKISGIKVDSVESCRVAAKYFFEKGVANVVITLGEYGVYVNDGINDKVIKPLKVDVVDTTGAGDAFNGGFVSGLAKGMTLFEAAEFGNIVAGLAVTKFGTSPAMPFEQEVQAYIESKVSNQ